MHEEKRCPSSRESIHFLSFLSRAFRQHNKSSFGKKGTEKNCCSRPALSDFARVLRSSRFNKGSPPLFNLATKRKSLLRKKNDA